VSIIFNTLFGIILFTLSFLFVIGIVFRDQIRRLTKYLSSWWAEDTRREERERRLREAERRAREENDLRESIARERAEAEVYSDSLGNRRFDVNTLNLHSTIDSDTHHIGGPHSSDHSHSHSHGGDSHAGSSHSSDSFSSGSSSDSSSSGDSSSSSSSSSD
jgi:hypothetical protein